MTAFSGDDLLAKIQPKLKESRIQVCLRPDLIGEWQDANEKLIELEAETAQGGRLNGPSSSAASKKQAREVQRIEAEIEEASAWFTFRALPVEKYQALCAEHPPRKDNQLDMMRGFNFEAVAEVLVARCLLDPVFSDEGWASFKTTCAVSEWSALRDEALEVNGAKVVTPPKSPVASRVLSKRGSASA